MHNNGNQGQIAENATKQKWGFADIVVLLVMGILIVGFAKGFFEDNHKDAKDGEKPNSSSQMEERLDSGVYPLYNSLNEAEKELYINICESMESFNETAVAVYETKEECDAVYKTFKKLGQTVLYEQPQYFWVNPNAFSVSSHETPDDNQYQLTVQLGYLLEKDEAMEKKEGFEKKVNEMVTTAKEKRSTFEQVLYVHDSILKNVAYDYELAEKDDFENLKITAYGCLMQGKTVCSGYTLAFNLLMHELGYECGSEFTQYSSLSLGAAHVWNYCKLDDDYYYFDLTWDDTGYDSAEYKPYMDYSYQYFGLTTEELSSANPEKQKNVPVPYCNGTKYNYYIYNGYNIPEYSFEAAKTVILKQNSTNHISLRFDDYTQLLKAERELLTNGRIHEILGTTKAVKYSLGSSAFGKLYLEIFYDI